MMIERLGSVIERQFSMTARGHVEIFPGKPIYVYAVNMIANPVNWSKFMIVDYVSSGTACIIPARDD